MSELNTRNDLAGECLQQALERLVAEIGNDVVPGSSLEAALRGMDDAVKAALRSAEPSDEPVAWMDEHNDTEIINARWKRNCPDFYANHKKPLYTHPPRPVSELSEERIREIAERWFPFSEDKHQRGLCIEAIRTALRESGDAKDARRALLLAKHALEGMNAILCGEVSQDWSELHGADWHIYSDALDAVNAALSGATHD